MNSMIFVTRHHTRLGVNFIGCGGMGRGRSGAHTSWRTAPCSAWRHGDFVVLHQQRAGFSARAHTRRQTGTPSKRDFRRLRRPPKHRLQEPKSRFRPLLSPRSAPSSKRHRPPTDRPQERTVPRLDDPHRQHRHRRHCRRRNRPTRPALPTRREGPQSCRSWRAR